MYSFKNDYSEGACPQIMEALIRSNVEQSVGYGLDEECGKAKLRIQDALQCYTSDIHFLVGGTQANLTVIASALRPYEAVISVESGHINVHETGAIEATGHKVLVCEGEDGKVSVAGIKKVLELHGDEHMVKPRMVYISNATEVGTIYSLNELQALRQICDQYDLYLYMDGARLPMALVTSENDVTLSDIAKYCDIFYLGGTKCGALFGEAVVIINDHLKQDFRYMIKQRGGLLAKGRLLGIQFSTLFQDELYYELARHANAMAQKLQLAMREAGVTFLVVSNTNQIFPILDNALLEQLAKDYQFEVWEHITATKTAIRLVTSWATPEEMVDAFLQDFFHIKTAF